MTKPVYVTEPHLSVPEEDRFRRVPTNRGAWHELFEREPTGFGVMRHFYRATTRSRTLSGLADDARVSRGANA